MKEIIVTDSTSSPSYLCARVGVVGERSDWSIEFGDTSDRVTSSPVPLIRQRSAVTGGVRGE